MLVKTLSSINLELKNIRTIEGGGNLKGIIKVPGDKSISHRALIIGSIAQGETTIDGFLHSNDLSYTKKSEEVLKEFNKGDKLKVKILEIKADEQKVRVGLKQLAKDPFDYFDGKKVNDIITVQVISSDNKGLVVKPEGCELEFIIKKSQIAVSSADARPSRFVGGERIDAAISEINPETRKVSLSIKLLEELQNKEAVSKFSSPLSGKNLPFSSLSEKLDDKKKKDKN